MMQDPFPGVRFDKALKELAERFGVGNVDEHPQNGKVYIEMPLKDGETQRFGFEWQEAKYLAFHPELCAEDFLNTNLPADRPSDTGT